jgi:hypothetical protein
VLSKYRSGKLPKAFKIIPALSNWEQILYVTEPEAWTAAAMYQATRWCKWVTMVVGREGVGHPHAGALPTVPSCASS